MSFFSPVEKGVWTMATKSILKTIHIKEPGAAAALVRALENAKGKSEKEVVFQRPPREASRADIQKMFGTSDGKA